MVWLFRYLPINDRVPNVEVAQGNWRRLGRRGEYLELEDYTPDGGRGLRFGFFELESGRRVKSDGVPKKVYWKSRKQPLDFEWVIFKSVSDRLRTLIEEIEPGVHQFEPLEFISKDGISLFHHWFWQICNRLDTIHRQKTDMVLDELVWKPNDEIPSSKQVGAVFDLERIGSASFWYDKHVSGGPFCSDHAKNVIVASGLPGFEFVPMKHA